MSEVGARCHGVREAMETTDVAAALESFDALAVKPEDKKDAATLLKEALDAIIREGDGLAADLEQVDSVAASRQAYVAGILRIRQFLIEPKYGKDAVEQAKVALGYVRHIESSRLAALQIGRSVKDESLARAVQDLRQQVVDLADKRAKVLAEVKERKVAALTR